MSSRVMAPGRSSTGTPRVQSTMVDSIPTSQAPPSSTSSVSPNSPATWAAVVGLTRPNLLALGADTPQTGGCSCWQAASTAWATGWEGQRRPTLSWPPVEARAAWGRRGRIRVSGPGQKASISCCANSGTSRA